MVINSANIRRTLTHAHALNKIEKALPRVHAQHLL